MNEETIENSIITSDFQSVSISFVEGYPLYSVFKKIYDEYVRDMNACVDDLIISNNPAGKIKKL